MIRAPGHGARTAARHAVAIVAFAFLAGCSSKPAEPAAHVVRLSGTRFTPAADTVPVGDTVVWTNDDLVPHTATAQDTRWDSGGIAPGASWRYVAEEKGSHAYICTFHPGMKATLVVR